GRCRADRRAAASGTAGGRGSAAPPRGLGGHGEHGGRRARHHARQCAHGRAVAAARRRAATRRRRRSLSGGAARPGAARRARREPVTQVSRPFVFTGCVELRQALDHRATDERELLERLEEVPAGSVFYHTHGYFLRHRPITTAYGNDFASWVATQVRDQVLAERLAVVNPFEFATLEQLREELVSIIHDHLLRLSAVPRVGFGEPFYFQQSHILEVPAGPVLKT